MAKAPMVRRLRKIGIDRVLDQRQFLNIGCAGKQREPVDQELAVGRAILKLERIESRRRAGPQHVVAPADRTDKELAAAVLVEEDEIGRASCRERVCQYV